MTNNNVKVAIVTFDNLVHSIWFVHANGMIVFTNYVRNYKEE